MGKFLSAPLIAAAFLMTFTAAPSWAAGDTVKVTPIGSHDGEFCSRDRAIVFEDPNGTRILFDAGRTVRGSGDPRLDPGIDVVLLSSVHGDHIGDSIRFDGPCANPTIQSSTTPNSNTAEIVAGTGAKVFSGGEMRDFLRAKVVAAGGSASQIDVLRPGGTRVFNDVEISVVMAVHSNGVGRSFLTDPLKASLAADGLTAYVGPDHGYIIKFTNGLVVYLTADTGQTSDMKLIIKDFYHPKLVVINMGGIFSMGPKEAAFAINNLINPRSVIPEHANEEATSGGVVLGGTKTEEFIGLLSAKISAHVPLSNVTMEFNRQGKCVAGC
ncbi:MAG: MBL fold metallo-hydrolase [Proteobacteria bacterium]|nr:MBL fold metallo-hydrolase [Pseudomonadota bacterium]